MDDVATSRRLHATRRSASVASALADELGAQDQTLDGVVAAVDLLGVARQADGLDYRAALQGLVGALDLQILDQEDTVTVGQQVADRIAHLDGSRRGFARSLLRGGFGRGYPLAAGLVVDIVVVAVGHFRFGSCKRACA